MIGFAGYEQVWQIEQRIILAEGFQQRIRRHAEIDGPGLCQLYHLVLGTQQFAGKNLHIVFVSELAFNVLLKSQKCDMRRMIGGLIVSDPDDLPAVLSG